MRFPDGDDPLQSEPALGSQPQDAVGIGRMKVAGKYKVPFQNHRHCLEVDAREGHSSSAMQWVKRRGMYERAVEGRADIGSREKNKVRRTKLHPNHVPLRRRSHKDLRASSINGLVLNRDRGHESQKCYNQSFHRKPTIEPLGLNTGRNGGRNS